MLRLARSPILRTNVLGFESQYGPKFKSTVHLGGFSASRLRHYAPMGAGFGAATVIALLFFAEEVPPVKRDIFQNIPIIGSYWVKEVAPEDNPF